MELKLPLKKSTFMRNHVNKKEPPIKSGYVYARHSFKTLIAEIMKLDFEFGCFCGLYLSEGFCTKNTVCISNNDKNVIMEIKKFAKKFNLNCYESISKNGFGIGKTVHINSTVFATFMPILFGRTSHEKFISYEVMNGPKDFISGLIARYFDGDGNINLEKSLIRASSVSKRLLDDVSILLTRFKVFSTKIKEKKLKNGFYSLYIYSKYSELFLKNFPLIIDYKKNDLLKIVKKMKKNKIPRDNIDKIPSFGNNLKKIYKKLKVKDVSLKQLAERSYKKQTIGRQSLIKFILNAEKQKRKQNIKFTKKIDFKYEQLIKAATSDVIWDEIVDFKYVKCKSKYVYDLGIPGTNTFMTSDGIITHNTLNTFHYAGVSSKNVTLGIPRLNELLNCYSKLKKHYVDVHLTDEYKNSKSVAIDLMEYLTLDDICIEQCIYYDPIPGNDFKNFKTTISEYER